MLMHKSQDEAIIISLNKTTTANITVLSNKSKNDKQFTMNITVPTKWT